MALDKSLVLSGLCLSVPKEAFKGPLVQESKPDRRPSQARECGSGVSTRDSSLEPGKPTEL